MFLISNYNKNKKLIEDKKKNYNDEEADLQNRSRDITAKVLAARVISMPFQPFNEPSANRDPP